MDWIQDEMFAFCDKLAAALGVPVVPVELKSPSPKALLGAINWFEIIFDANPYNPLEFHRWREVISLTQRVLPVDTPMPEFTKIQTREHTPFKTRWMLHHPLEADFWVKCGEQAIDLYWRERRMWAYREDR